MRDMEVGEVRHAIQSGARLCRSTGTVVAVYRFLLRPKWIVLSVVVIALVVTMINLGLWQLRRLDQRQSFNSEVRSNLSEEPAPLAEVLTASTDPHDVEWRQVTVSGTYEGTAQVLIRDRSLNATPGFNVVTPLVFDNGDFVAVTRGWIPGDQTAAPPAPPGTITVVGRLRVTQERRHSWEKADPDTGVLDKMNRVDVARIDQQVEGDAVSMYLEVVESAPADDAVALIPAPDLNNGPHLSYAIQWFLFTTAAIAGWCIAVRRHITGERKRAARTTKAVAASAGATVETAADS